MNKVILYCLVAILLVVIIQLYFIIARRLNITDRPNNRSSHSVATIRGGGIIFPMAIILYTFFFHGISAFLLSGFLVIGIISFLDDVKDLSSRIRIFFHFLAVSSLLWSIEVFQLWPIWLIVLTYLVIIGTINAYNFMDGINGITGLYSLSILSALLYINHEVVSFMDQALIICLMIACFVFLFFNFRKKAKCFAGDVGSVSMGFFVVSLLLILMMKTDSLKYVLFLAVYGVDAVLTIVHRLFLKQNIFKAHRMHFYQVLANERKVPHLWISTLYAAVQSLINTFIIATDYKFLVTACFVLVPLSLLYVSLKTKWMV